MKIYPSPESVRKKVLVLELLAVVFGIGLSIYGIIKVCEYDISYLGYIVFPILGLAIIAGIILSLIKKYKNAHIIFIAVIAVWGILAGFAYLVCQAQSVRLRNESNQNAIYYEENTEKERTDN